MRLLTGACAVLMAIATPASAGKPSSNATEEAVAAADAFHSALSRGDQQAAAALLADDALIFEEGGAERSKAEYVAKHLPADAAFSQAVGAKVTRRANGSGDMLAWVATEGRTTGTYKGKPVDRVTTESMLLRREGANWRIIHIHWSSAPAR